jgi:plasmid maintenance system antidote protein VapI
MLVRLSFFIFGILYPVHRTRQFGNSARCWLTLQTDFELAVAERETGARIMAEVNPAEAA